MQASNEEVRHNRELEYRAYVMVKGAGLVPQADTPEMGVITVTTFNSGRTPGIGSIKAVLRLREDSPPEDEPVDIADKPSRIIFAPLIDINTRVTSIPVQRPTASPEVTQPAAKAKSTPASPAPALPVENKAGTPGGIEFYVFGYIEYKDIFRKTHWTKFCVYNVPGTDKWTYCPTFNDAN